MLDQLMEMLIKKGTKFKILFQEETVECVCLGVTDLKERALLMRCENIDEKEIQLYINDINKIKEKKNNTAIIVSTIGLENNFVAKIENNYYLLNFMNANLDEFI